LTAGPTREHLDPVRFLSNGSSGKMGYALAAGAVAQGWDVDLISGPVSLPPPAGVTVHPVVSAAEMMMACEPLFSRCDLFIAVAAVADFRPKDASARKRKKEETAASLELVPTVDILRTLSARKQRQIVVGFAAETHDVEAYARRKLVEKRLDWIVANDVSGSDSGMNADNNAILLLGADGTRKPYGPAPKTAVAEFILSRLGLPGCRNGSLPSRPRS
jgi:phosphopantothenoylcysteine decarboxylase/phosphopantothenate--cysteine ligase